MGRPVRTTSTPRSDPVRPILRLLPHPTEGRFRLGDLSMPTIDGRSSHRGVLVAVAGLGMVAARVALRRRRARHEREASQHRVVADLRSEVRQRDDALASATHDLRTPLTALKGHAQLLQRVARPSGDADGERLRAGLAAIDAAATAVAARIDRLAEESERAPRSGL